MVKAIDAFLNKYRRAMGWTFREEFQFPDHGIMAYQGEKEIFFGPNMDRRDAIVVMYWAKGSRTLNGKYRANPDEDIEIKYKGMYLSPQVLMQLITPYLKMWGKKRR